MKELFCYIHIPFCTSKCKYCRFASFGNLDKLKINIYVNFLINEIKSTKIPIKYKGTYLKSIYFGGGTPSVLSKDQLEKIILSVKDKYIFDDNIEINIEATPNTITQNNIKGWKEIGINRLSMGIQTLNNKSLIEIGRGKQSDIIIALNNIKKIGFRNVSIDFIIGLPYVKKGEIKNNIKYILNKFNFIKHISVYMLEEYYDVPNEINSKFENIIYPNNWNKIGILDDDFLEEYIDIKNFLKENNIYSYEISNFSKKGFECKHNQSYWNHSDIVSFGLGAYSFINNIRYSNSEKFTEYYLGKQSIEKQLTKEDLFIETMMFQLRTGGLTEKIYKNLDTEKISFFIREQYLEKKYEKNNKVYKIIPLDKGILVLDYILKEIIKN